MTNQRSPATECELHCTSGSVTARIGDRFRESNETEWEIIGFGVEAIYSPSSLGGTPNVFCKTEQMPGHYRRYAEDDHTLEFCGDSVAAMMLQLKDGKSRDARGYPLRKRIGATPGGE